YFQHDGAPPHNTHLMREHLNAVFLHRRIGRGGTVQSPPRSLDLTPLDFCLWVDADFLNKIIFSDEAHFHLDGLINRQNCIWDSENPRVIVKKQMHPQRVIVWCEFWAGGIIEPFFFENAAGQAITVNGARYRDMIIQFFVPKLQDMDVNNMWFQQDSATCHTARETI
ncbi:hypothetical protein EAI_06029, partial [Harpegnathos saltator]